MTFDATCPRCRHWLRRDHVCGPVEIRCCLNPHCPGLIAGHLDELRADPETAPIIEVLDDLLAELGQIVKDLEQT